MTPIITVVVPLYNLARKLTRAIESIIAQDFVQWECIIIDDGSTDGGGDLADLLALRDMRIRVVHQENAGLSNALNAGFKQAHGREFMILSADDALSPYYMRKTHERMQKLGVDIVSTDMMVLEKTVECIGGSVESLRQGNCHHYAALYKRWLYDKMGGYKAAMNPSWEDYEWWVSCAEACAQWAHVVEPLFMYYPSPNGRTVEADGKDRLLQGKLAGYHPKTFGTGKGLVAVVIPCYEHEQYVREAVESVLAQTYPHKAAVVINDASPSWDKHCLKGVECQVLHHKENRGLAAARNTGLSWVQNELQAEYWIALDADDTLHPEFIERTMGVMGDRDWVYSDVQFIGDAWHTFDLQKWDCMRIGSKHQNPCTFLAQMDMYREIWRHRTYAYDESPRMRVGYEDMEFGLACVQQGWAGQRLPGHWFNYRFHNDGSMRTRANAVKAELVRYIANQHPWAYTMEGLRMACKSCGGAKNVKIKGNQVEIDTLGVVPLGEPLKVTFGGDGTGKRTKIGASGRVYRFSSEARSFIIDSRDAFLFENVQFTISRVTRQMPVVEGFTAAVQQAQVQTTTLPVVEDVMAFDLGVEAQPTGRGIAVVTETKDKPLGKMSMLPNLTGAHVTALWKAGYRSIRAVGGLTIDKMERITGLTKKEAQEVIEHARLQRAA